jgi:hypothetical protein
MRQTFAWIVLLLIVVHAAAQAPGPNDEIDKLVAQLNSSKYAQRVTAAKALEDIGAPALPALQRAAENGELEMRHRAAAIIERIEHRLAVAPLLTGSKIRLVYKDMPVLEAVSDLGAKLGWRVDVEGDRVPLHSRKITLDTGEVPFWEAFAQFCKAAGLVERKVPAVSDGKVLLPGRLALILGEAKPLPTALAGPLRLRVLTADAASGALVLEVAPQLKMPWLGTRAVRITKVVGADGQSLPLPEPYVASTPSDEDKTPDWRTSAPGTVFQPEVVRLELPAAIAQGTVLKEVHGTISGSAEVLRKLAVVKNVMQATGKSFALAKTTDGLKVVNVKGNGDHVGVTLRIEGPLALAIIQEMSADARLGKLRSLQCILLDAKGQAWKVTQMSGNPAFDDNGDAFALVGILFERQPNQAAPGQLIVSGFVSTPLEFPFVLRDVSLPKY